jgi:hypothetical protein
LVVVVQSLKPGGKITPSTGMVYSLEVSFGLAQSWSAASYSASSIWLMLWKAFAVIGCSNRRDDEEFTVDGDQSNHRLLAQRTDKFRPKASATYRRYDCVTGRSRATDPVRRGEAAHRRADGLMAADSAQSCSAWLLSRVGPAVTDHRTLVVRLAVS